MHPNRGPCDGESHAWQVRAVLRTSEDSPSFPKAARPGPGPPPGPGGARLRGRSWSGLTSPTRPRRRAQRTGEGSCVAASKVGPDRPPLVTRLIPRYGTSVQFGTMRYALAVNAYGARRSILQPPAVGR